jgi:hypothetical protein
VRLLVLGERHAPIVLALLGAPAAAASPAPARVLIGRLRLSAAIAAPLSRGWLRGGAGPPRRLRRDGRWPETRGVGVQLLVNELDDDAADNLADGAAQLVSDERLERLPGRRGHDRSLRRLGPRIPELPKRAWVWTHAAVRGMR